MIHKVTDVPKRSYLCQLLGKYRQHVVLEFSRLVKYENVARSCKIQFCVKNAYTVSCLQANIRCKCPPMYVWGSCSQRRKVILCYSSLIILTSHIRLLVIHGGVFRCWAYILCNYTMFCSHFRGRSVLSWPATCSEKSRWW